MDRHPSDVPATGAPLIRSLGQVSWFCPDRGFGFIHPDDGGEDVFVTWGALPGAGFRSVDSGQRLAYWPDHDAYGPTARDVELLAD